MDNKIVGRALIIVIILLGGTQMLFAQEPAIKIYGYELKMGMSQTEAVKQFADKHGVLIEEVEEVLNSNPHIRKVGKGHVKGEHLYAAFGQTEGGRYLVIIYIKKRTGALLPISARDMDKGERNYYGKQKEND